MPGAGVRPYRGLPEIAARGLIVFRSASTASRRPAAGGVRPSRPGRAERLSDVRLDSRERYYYRRVYVGTLRANDFLASLPQWDGRDLAVTGGSQGGALAIVTAGLDRRVTRLAASSRALGRHRIPDQRAGGWPHMFRAATTRTPIATTPRSRQLRSYDVINFARRITAPGLYSSGFNDETCPPDVDVLGVHVVAAPKHLILARDTGHRTTQEQVDDVHDWLADSSRVEGGRRRCR